MSLPAFTSAQQLSVLEASPKQVSISDFVEDYKQYLESEGFTEVILTPNETGFSGTAQKDGKRVEVTQDDKGLHRSDIPSTSPGSSRKGRADSVRR